jgi:hypothetical protein
MGKNDLSVRVERLAYLGGKVVSFDELTIEEHREIGAYLHEFLKELLWNKEMDERLTRIAKTMVEKRTALQTWPDP